MTEHVHDYGLRVVRELGGAYIEIACGGGEELTGGEARRRINAGGMLSAKSAHFGAMCIDIVHEGYGETDKGAEAEKALRAYADILEATL